MSTGLPARKAALAIVSGVLRRRRALDFQLEDLKSLEPRDAGFARALASQTLRHLGLLDAVLREFMRKAAGAAQGGRGAARSCCWALASC